MENKIEHKISVLMSVYAKDNPAWLKEALDSVLHQTVLPAEVIVVVDGPVSQEIKQILQDYQAKYPILRPIYHPKNEGLGSVLSKGINYCNFELIARMDSDDISLPNRFELQLAAFEKNPQLAICGGAIEEIEPNTKQIIVTRQLPLTDQEIKKFLTFRSPFNHVSVMFKKAAVLVAGNYQSAHLMEDYHLWIRMSAKNFTMQNLPQVLVKVRTGKDMFARRGGYKYFLSNKAVQDLLLKTGLIHRGKYLFNLAVRFCVQVLMPNKIRAIFYQKILRKKY